MIKLRDILFEVTSLKEEDDDQNVVLRDVLNPGLVFDDEESRDGAFTWLQDINNYPEDIKLQALRGTSKPQNTIIKGTKLDNPQTYVDFLNGDLPTSDYNQWTLLKFGPRGMIRRKLEKQISQLLGEPFTFPLSVGPANKEAYTAQQSEFEKQKSSNKTRLPLLFVKQDATGIKFPAEENNKARNISKDKLKKVVKYLSDKMVSLYFNEQTEYKDE
jgi:hypothetical protein